MTNSEHTLATVGHELRTLVTLIMANIDILEMEKGKSEWIDDIREECNRSSFLINKIMEGSQQQLPPGTQTNVSAQVKRMARFFRPLGKEKNLSLHCDIAEGVYSHADRSDIVQVLSVLFGNAVKYCDLGGSISVNLRQTEEDHFTLSISNDFADASSAHTAQFFDAFYREPHPDEKGKGFGLGLAIAKDIVLSYSGSIEATANGAESKITLLVSL